MQLSGPASISTRRAGAVHHVTSKPLQGHSLTDADLPWLRERWLKEISDITGPIPLELPPFREVNHRIPLIDPKKPIKHCYSKCPDTLRPALMEKIVRYVTAGWWEEMNVPQASLLLCIPK